MNESFKKIEVFEKRDSEKGTPTIPPSRKFQIETPEYVPGTLLIRDT